MHRVTCFSAAYAVDSVTSTTKTTGPVAVFYLSCSLNPKLKPLCPLRPSDFYHCSWVPACRAGGWSAAFGCLRAQLGGGKTFPTTGPGPRRG